MYEPDYGPPIVVQNTRTSFGDATHGTLANGPGSELDAAYARIEGENLHLLLAGNLENNFNRLEVFIDTTPGGQSRLRGDNPDVDFNRLNRLGDDGSGNGLRFEPGFDADYYLTLGGGGAPYVLYANYARLRNGGDPGAGFYLGANATPATTGVLAGGDSGAPAIRAAFNNSNTAGVGLWSVATPLGSGDGVQKGLELVIPLSAIGNPTCGIKVVAFINSADHAFVSNQVLPGIGGGDNLGDPRLIDFGPIPGVQYFFAEGGSAPANVLASPDTTKPRFGEAVATDAQFLVVGAGVNQASGGAAGGGRAHVYSNVGTPAQTRITLVPADPQTSDGFGSALALSRQGFGSYVAVGAPRRDVSGVANAGSVTVFRPFFGDWPVSQTISDPALIAEAQFGASVAADGDWLVIGAPAERESPTSVPGAAYVYKYVSGTWTFKARLRSSDRGHVDQFGSAVAVSGNTIVVGAWAWDAPISDSGSVYVFDTSSPSWPPSTELTETLKINNPTPAAGDNFGRWVALSGDNLVIATPNDANGAAYFYRRTAGVWGTAQRVVQSDTESGDRFAASVSISGDLAVVGAQRDDAPLLDQGTAYIFKRTDMGWTEQARLLAPDAIANAEFGRAVAIKGSVVAVGAPVSDPLGQPADTGAAYRFVLNLTGPTIECEPADATIRAGVPTTLQWCYTLRASGTYEIFRNNVSYFGPITVAGGSDSVGVTLGNPGPSYAGAWRLVVTDECGQSASSTVNVSVAPFGDVNGDGITNCADACAFGSAYGAVLGHPNYRVDFDYDQDGDVDLTDKTAFYALNPCPADFNQSGSITVQDIFDFLAGYFAGCTALGVPSGVPPCYGSADINNSGAITVQDIFDFLAAYFRGCN